MSYKTGSLHGIFSKSVLYHFFPKFDLEEHIFYVFYFGPRIYSNINSKLGLNCIRIFVFGGFSLSKIFAYLVEEVSVFQIYSTICPNPISNICSTFSFEFSFKKRRSIFFRSYRAALSWNSFDNGLDLIKVTLMYVVCCIWCIQSIPCTFPKFVSILFVN